MKSLTPMQAAYWAGRNATGPLGGVTAHLYAEFDGTGLNAGRLEAALERLAAAHPNTRLKIVESAYQIIDEAGLIPFSTEIYDNKYATSVNEWLEHRRAALCGTGLDLSKGKALVASLSQLPEGRSRFHLDCDMAAIDPVSFLTLMDDLASLYEDPQKPWDGGIGSYEDYLAALMSAPDRLERMKADRNWWQARLGEIAPAPPLPITPTGSTIRSRRLSARLSPQQRQSLQACARKGRVTLSVLLLALFAAELGKATGARRFRLNVPGFWRERLVPQVERIVGEFANVLVISVDLDRASSLADLARQVGVSVAGALGHASYPGVHVMRDLSRHTGALEVAPVVFTAGLSLGPGHPSDTLLSERVKRVFGEMTYVISEGPHVAIDAQIATMDGGLFLNWDIRQDALPDAFVDDFFHGYAGLLTKIAGHPAHLEAKTMPDPQRPIEWPLTGLQKAYLMGRSNALPLGGVAMQEFREYRGSLDLRWLEQRLQSLVQAHPALRTVIDAERLVARIDAQPKVHFEPIDLTHMPREAALASVEARREAFAHALSDLSTSPWQVMAFQLPGGEAVIFLRIDALIADGRSIAALMTDLFGTHELQAQEADPPAEDGLDEARRHADQQYWTEKLAATGGPPQLPYLQPPEKIATSRYDRQSLTLSKETGTSLLRAGAKAGLFANSILTALLLEALSHFLSEGTLTVGLPVAPQGGPGLPLQNRSSFIALDWRAREDDFARRAARLQQDVLEGLDHLAFSGIDLNRLLMGNAPGQLQLPVVITNGLSWPMLPKVAPVALHGSRTQTPQVAMDLRFSKDMDGQLRFDIDYARSAFDAATVADLLAVVARLAEAIHWQQSLDLGSINPVAVSHYHRNSTPQDAVPYAFLDRIADHLFLNPPARNAIVQAERSLSYAELGNGVARILQAFRQLDIRTGNVVAIALARSPEHSMVALAAALSGVIWVPIDASSPSDRLAYLLENCKPDLVVSLAAPDAEMAGRHRFITPEALLAHHPATDTLADCPDPRMLSLSEEPAYYLYTSGTTGRPKCVVLNNRATDNVIGRTLENWAVTAEDVFISVTPLHHDMSIFDVFGAFAAGATLVQPAAGEEKDAMAWNRLVDRHGVSLWCSVPAILDMFLACRPGNSLGSLRLIAQGGDYIKPAVIADLRRRKPSLRLVSLGGPTETTIWSIWHEIGPQDHDLIPYGEPLPGNRYFVLDDQGRHCPAGVVGRIHTAGVNVALGYLEDARLTQTDFVTVEDEHGVAVRAFRTGDRGKYRRDGRLIFDSRVNGYVKIRGVRVSLPDIENEFAAHPDLRRAMVVDYGAERQGETAIGLLYVGAVENPPTPAALRSFALQHLPQSHVPGLFLAVEDLPLSANGKPDRRKARALLEQAASAPRPARADAPVLRQRDRPNAPLAVTPQVPAANDDGPVRIAAIYKAVIDGRNAAALGPAGDFLRAGLLPSHLKTISLRLREELGIDLPVPALARCRTAEQVAALASARKNSR
ncbi:amino acid adenylation domain-containing protein [Allorhizobium undicola]|uniref:amino acid adenylation domain-containing protein n=1 Tax=Allorhizobium undicola TaxID=78527 RepID=UPI001FDA4668|nr:amino acid adenylation domain-containing protein [Allorhizobium undicola]